MARSHVYFVDPRGPISLQSSPVRARCNRFRGPMIVRWHGLPWQLTRELVEFCRCTGDDRTEQRRTWRATDNGLNVIPIVADHEVDLKIGPAIRCISRMGSDRHPASAIVINMVRTASGPPCLHWSDTVVDHMINLRHVPVAVEVSQGHTGNSPGCRCGSKNLTCDREGVVTTKGRVRARGMLPPLG